VCTAIHKPAIKLGTTAHATMTAIFLRDLCFFGWSFNEVGLGGLIASRGSAAVACGSAACSLMVPLPYDKREKWQMF
jgi:hypothetical protein